MSIKTTLEWEKVSEQGLPIIGNINQTVLFINAGAVYEGWPVAEEYYTDIEEDMPTPTEWEWETLDGHDIVIGVEYWTYLPSKLKHLCDQDVITNTK